MSGTIRTSAGSAGQVLEFELGEETYCVGIDHVAEIVDVGKLTEVPNSPPHVRGVMDLRGQTTSIIDPKVVFAVDGEDGDDQRIVVFDADVVEDQVAAGWLVDGVDQVSKVDPGSVDEAPAEDDDSILGVIRREESFLIWVDPARVHEA